MPHRMNGHRNDKPYRNARPHSQALLQASSRGESGPLPLEEVVSKPLSSNTKWRRRPLRKRSFMLNFYKRHTPSFLGLSVLAGAIVMVLLLSSSKDKTFNI